MLACVCDCEAAVKQHWLGTDSHCVSYKQTHLIEGPRHSSPFTVYHWTSHDFPSSLEQYQWGQLLSQRGSANSVPVQGKIMRQLTQELKIIASNVYLKHKWKKKWQYSCESIIKKDTEWRSRKNIWPLRNFSIASDVHLPKPESSTVIPAKYNKRSTWRSGCVTAIFQITAVPQCQKHNI